MSRARDIADTHSGTVALTSADGVGDNANALVITNAEATAGRNFGIKVVGGTNASDHSFRADNSSGTSLFEVQGDGVINIANGVGTLFNNSGTFTIDANTNLTFRGGVQTFDNADGSTEYMRLTSTGLGIGDNNPSYRLTVAVDADTWASRIYNTGSDANASGLLVRTDATAAHDALALGVYADSGYKMVVRSTGNVGVGITSPDQKMHLYTSSGTTLYKAEVNANSTVGLEIKKTGSTTQTWRIVDGETVNGALQFYDVTDSRVSMQIDGSGNSTFAGTVTATGFSGKIHPVSGTTTNYLSLKDSNELNFFNSSDQSQTLYINYDAGDLNLAQNALELTSAGGAIFKKVVQIVGDDLTTNLRLRGRSTDNNFYTLYQSSNGSATIASFGTDAANDTFNYQVDNHAFQNLASNTTYMKIDSNGTLLVGKTADGPSVTGFQAHGTGVVHATLSSGTTYHLHDGSNYKFYVNANGGVYNFQSNDSNLSDEREKKNISSLGSKWDAVKKWSLKEFHYNADADSDSKKVGVIAQDIEDDHPDLVTEYDLTDTEKRKAVKEQQMTWMSIKALQEAMEKIETLEAKVAKLEE